MEAYVAQPTEEGQDPKTHVSYSSCYAKINFSSQCWHAICSDKEKCQSCCNEWSCKWAWEWIASWEDGISRTAIIAGWCAEAIRGSERGSKEEWRSSKEERRRNWEAEAARPWNPRFPSYLVWQQVCITWCSALSSPTQLGSYFGDICVCEAKDAILVITELTTVAAG